MALSPEKRAKYISVIIRKCDEVTRLTNDMLLHSLSDMDKLKTEPMCFELGGLIDNLISDMNGEKNNIRFENPSYPISVFAGPHRTEQIAENLITNAVKYACTEINVSITRDERFASVHVRHSKTPRKALPEFRDVLFFDICLCHIAVFRMLSTSLRSRVL